VIVSSDGAFRRPAARCDTGLEPIDRPVTIWGMPAWWDELEEPWRECLELAWEASCSGNVPVGAVVVDDSGGIVSRGRSRRVDASAPDRQIAGTVLAHAEINALMAMRFPDTYDKILYSSLQPCLLCTSAAMHSRIRAVHFAVADPLFVGIERLPQLNSHFALRWPEWHCPVDEPFARLSQLLVDVYVLEAAQEPELQAMVTGRSADDVRLARDVSRIGLLRDQRDQSLATLVAAISDAIEEFA
jgi:tRNA(adenine34) deaminase